MRSRQRCACSDAGVSCGCRSTANTQSPLACKCAVVAAPIPEAALPTTTLRCPESIEARTSFRAERGKSRTCDGNDDCKQYCRPKTTTAAMLLSAIPDTPLNEESAME